MKICERPVFILCSASSGSTLLSIILDRHPDIAIGPELFFFDKPFIYQNFKNFKFELNKRLKKGALSGGQVQNIDFLINKESYFWDTRRILDLVEHVNNLKEFVDCFFSHFLEQRKKKIWGEKTGSNAYHLDSILAIYPNCRIIHLARNPIDTIESIKKRGGSGYHAVSHYLYNHAAALSYKNCDGYLRVRYEDLVVEPEKQLKSICKHIGVEFSSTMLQRNKNENDYWKKCVSIRNIQKSWHHKPFDKLDASLVGTKEGFSAPEDFYLFKNLYLSKRSLAKLKLPAEWSQMSCSTIANELGYLQQPRSSIRKIPVRTYIFKDYLKRLLTAIRVGERLDLPLFRFLPAKVNE
jgi:hypothetical protein